MKKFVCLFGLFLISASMFAPPFALAGEEHQTTLISPNTASVDMLASLPGMNKELAMAIVTYRETLGDLQTVDELLEVDGMTEEILRGIRNYISVDPIKTDCGC